MTSRPAYQPYSLYLLWGCAILGGLRIWVEHKWPGSVAYVVVNYAGLAFFVFWIGSFATRGYLRRRPYWARESWLRYLRLFAMPILSLILLFTEMYFFDPDVIGPNFQRVFGAPDSALRTLWILIDLGLMGFGAIGAVLALGWLHTGDAAAPFARTRWFRLHGKSAISD
jgi:hypothetical protein